MRATFCCYDKPGIVGGTSSWIQWLVPELRRAGIDARCLVFLHTGESGPVTRTLEESGVPCTTHSMEGFAEDRVRWILETVATNPCDVFVPNEVPSAYHASRWIRQAGIPTVGILHTDGDAADAMQALFVFGRKSDALSVMVCVSTELESRLKRRGPVNTRLVRIPYGAEVPLETSRFASDTPLRMAFVGRLADEQKRISDVTDAFIQAVSEVPATEAVIYGAGPQGDKVAQIIATRGANLPVRLHGRLEPSDVQNALLGCHVIVLLSDYEGLPVALMEAMACGCVPVCIEMQSGIPELVENGVTGLLVTDRGPDFVRAIRRLREDEGLWTRLSIRAKQRIESSYSHQRSAEAWVGLLNGVISPGGKRAIRIPDRIRLPAVRASLESGADRMPGHFQTGFVGPVRRLAGRFARRLWKD
jgi:colanic acid/amylovoran biosynthesis glycosyltransferase